MEFVEVSTQAELDAALARAGVVPVIRGGGRFHVSGSASVRAYGSARVWASGSASVEAYDSASVEASGSASVWAYDSASVWAYGSASVWASGSASVWAYDSASVRAYDSARVEASKYVAVQRHGTNATVSGGVLIQIPSITTAEEWCDFYGVEVEDGVATVYKAVDDNYRSAHGFDYSPGTQPIAPDWDGGVSECGGGLHFAPRPFVALGFMREATRFIACPVRVEDIVVHEHALYPDKVKAPGVCGPVWEVDLDGEPVTGGGS